MKRLRPRSLRWKLTTRLIGAQLAILVFLGALVQVVTGFLWHSGSFNHGTDAARAVQAVAASVNRDAQGRLVFEQGPEFTELLREMPSLWFIVRDTQGQMLSYGEPPASVASASKALDSIAYADLVQDIRKSEAPYGTVQWANSRAGDLKVMTTARSAVTRGTAWWNGWAMFVVSLGYLSLVMVVAVVCVTPWVVKRTLSGVKNVSDTASSIDFNRRGTRLDEASMPAEIQPFVQAVNGAFNRLDEGFEAHKRFLSDAAHELRTPVAIIRTRISALPPGEISARLLADTTRLTVLANQLLDIHSFEERAFSFKPVELVDMAKRVIADIAPLAVAGGYDIVFDSEAAQVWIEADLTAIERVLTNLLQNAINYGGQRGQITVQIGKAGNLDVLDQGEGVPEKDADRIFEPFHRINQDGRGAGLGLSLVKIIMDRHRGRIELIRESAASGAHFSLVFPNPRVIVPGS